MSKTQTTAGRLSMRDVSMGVAMVAIVAFFALHPKGSQFLSPQNLSNLSIELSITAALALGMLLVLLPGMIDLSVGSGVGMLGGIAAVFVISPSYVLGVNMAGWPAGFALLASLVIALGVWYLMGRLIAYRRCRPLSLPSEACWSFRDCIGWSSATARFPLRRAVKRTFIPA